MCGKLKHSGIAETLSKNPAQWSPQGQEVPIRLSNGSKVKAVFNGHARQENLSTWKDKGWTEADVLATGYTEGKGYLAHEYDVQLGRVIRCLVKQVGDKYICNVVTRCSIGKEFDVNSRWPVLIPRRF